MTIPRRNKPGVAFWAAVVAAALLVGYPLSLGPACWISSYTSVGVSTVSVAYRPMMWLYEISPEPVGGVILWYSEIGAADGWCWTGADTWARL